MAACGYMDVASVSVEGVRRLPLISDSRGRYRPASFRRIRMEEETTIAPSVWRPSLTV